MFRILVFFCGALVGLKALAENVPRPASARKTPVRTTNSPIKTRRLKKPDREADFFFMNGYDVDGISRVERRCSGTATNPSTLFQFVGMIALGFYRVRKRLASFFSVFSTRPAWTEQIFFPLAKARIRMRMMTALLLFSLRLAEVPVSRGMLCCRRNPEGMQKISRRCKPPVIGYKQFRAPAGAS